MKFVGLDGLSHFWTKAKSWIAGQITAEVTAKIAEIVANAPEDLDTLKEIADWISAHANDASAMNSAILANTEAISGKADKNHTHTKSQITDFDHTHDDRYYTESEIDTKLSGKSNTGHTHTKSQITDFPTSLPANGGTADYATRLKTFASWDNPYVYDATNDIRLYVFKIAMSSNFNSILIQIYDDINYARCRRYVLGLWHVDNYGYNVSVTDLGGTKANGLKVWLGNDGNVYLQANVYWTSRISFSHFDDITNITVEKIGTAKYGSNKDINGNVLFTPLTDPITDCGAIRGSADLSSASISGQLLKANVTGNVTGNLTGNVTGNVSGSSGSCTGNSATATTADKAVSVVDYGDTSKTIKIGYTGAGATVDNLSHIAGYLTGGTQIKDVSKSVLQSWLGLSNYLPLSGGTVTGATQFNNYVKLNAWTGYGTGTANFWYDGNHKFVEIQNATDLKLANVNVSKEGHKHSASDITSGVLPVANGGTGKTTANDAANSFINSLIVGNDVPQGEDYYVAQHAGGGTTITTYYRRPVSKLWEYIKDKISSVLGLTKDTYGGKASTAGTADMSRNMYYQNIDLSPLDKTKFYPLFCASYTDFAEVAICSESGMGTMDYNQNRIHFDISTQGWSDLPPTLNIREYACYENNEITIGCIGRGLRHGAWAIWLRGGLHYTCYSRDSNLRLHTSDYTFGDEVYTVGTNYYGGSNTNVSIMFTPQSTITEGAYSSRPITAPNIKVKQKMVIPIGAPSSLEDGCIWIS